MFDLGLGEIFVILVVALIILGPEKLPKFARLVGRVVGKFRSVSQQIQYELTENPDLNEINKLGENLKTTVTDIQNQVKHDFNDFKTELNQLEKKIEPLNCSDPFETNHYPDDIFLKNHLPQSLHSKKLKIQRVKLNQYTTKKTTLKPKKRS